MFEEKDVFNLIAKISASHVEFNITPTSPKQKEQKAGAKTNQTGRKASKAVQMAVQDETFNLVFQCHYYPSFIQAFVSKMICLASSYLAKKNLFEHICNLYSRVNLLSILKHILLSSK